MTCSGKIYLHLVAFPCFARLLPPHQRETHGLVAAEVGVFRSEWELTGRAGEETDASVQMMCAEYDLQQTGQHHSQDT